MATQRVICGECVAVMAGMEPSSVDAIVTDPPYGIGFMGKEWDVFAPETVAALAHRRNRKGTVRRSAQWPEKRGTTQGAGAQIEYDESRGGNVRYQGWCAAWLSGCLHVLKPGCPILVFGGTRTWHRLACAVEDAGFRISDTLMWLYGSGFPKHRTLLKPAWEPVIVAKKPGRGGLNTEAGRLVLNGESPPSGSGDRRNGLVYAQDEWTRTKMSNGGNVTPVSGRWPANVALDEAAADLLDGEVGNRASGAMVVAYRSGLGYGSSARGTAAGIQVNYPDAGGPSRFFYTAKASRAERDRGLDALPVRPLGTMEDDGYEWPDGRDTRGHNHHPTVKPLALMQWIVRLACPPGGTLLDPFLGSGTTLIAADREGLNGIGIEREAAYAAIARARIRGDAPLFADVV